MGSLQLLDCTLRDGGYINDWAFGEEAIEETIEKMTASGVDILEIGFLKDEKYKKSRTVFNEMKQVSELIKPKNKALQYAVMIEVVNPLPLEMLEVRSEDSADIIRVIVWKRLLQEGFEYCKGVVEKGYKLCVQPARVDQYSYQEFVEMIELFNQIDPLAVYVVDSFGTQTTETLLPYLELADKHLKPGIAVGYHGHNNMMQAASVAESFVNQKLDRDMIIDASIYGMGRGAGNLNLELFAQYMNLNFDKHYKIDPMLEVFDKYLKGIYNWRPWGYSLPYYLTAINKCNPNYASFYDQDLHLPAETIGGVLKMMSEEDRIIFTEEKAREYLRLYGKKKMNLAVIVPTCNRWKSIDGFLFTCAPSFRNYGVDLIIYDSSDDDRTKAVVSNFLLEGYNNVYYKRYDGTFDGFSLDHKVIDALREHMDQYDYLWVCRDGLTILLPGCYDDILEFTEKKFDCIIVDTYVRNLELFSKLEEDETTYSKVYDNCVELFAEQTARMTILGSMIFSRNMVKTLLEQYPLDDSNYGLWLPAAPLHYFAGHKLNVVSYIGEVFGCNVGITPNSFWNKSGKAMQQWACRWYQIVDMLPKVYDEKKAEVLKIEMSDFHPFSVGSLLRMRGNSGLNAKLIKQYEQYLPHVCDTPLWKFYVVARLPRFFARLLVDYPYSRPVRLLVSIYHFFFKREKLADEE